MADTRNESHPISFLLPQVMTEDLSVKIREYESHLDNEKDKESKWLFYF